MIAVQIKNDHNFQEGRVLELAFCAPYVSIELAKLTDASFEVLIEDSIELAVCQERVHEAGYDSRFAFHLGESVSLPFPDRSFDLVLARDALRFWHTEVKVYREINRVLKPGAIVYMGGGLGNGFFGPESERIWSLVQDWRNATDHIPWVSTLPFPEQIETALMTVGIKNYELWTEGHCTCRTWVSWQKTQSMLPPVYDVHHIQTVMDSLQDIGKRAPDFTLQTPDGEMITLSDLRGSIVVLDFWAVNCRSCLWMMKQLAMVREKYTAEDCRFIAINIDGEKSKLDDFLKEKRVPYTVLYDDGDVDKKYGIRGLPHFIIINQQGIIHSRVIGGTPETVERIEFVLAELVRETKQ
jgi:peroxiredoxin/SAM-dependent methyltransferase